MADPLLGTPHNSQGSLVSYRCLTGGVRGAPLAHKSSFVMIGGKRSFRPPPSILNTLVQFFPERVPLSFGVASPAVRLFTESTAAAASAGEGGDAIGGGSNGAQRAGFQLDGYCVTRAPTEPFIAPCDDGGAVEDDAPPAPSRAAAFARSTVVHSSGTFSAAVSVPISPPDSAYIQAYPFHFAGPVLTSGPSVAERHFYPYAGYLRHKRMRIAAGGAPTAGQAGAGTGGRSPTANGAAAGTPPPQSPIGSSGRLDYSLAAEMELCESRCWHGGSSDLSLCASLRCTSTKGLHMALFSAWWLSRYYGITLTIEGLREKGQVAVFKEVARLLSIKELVCVQCTLDQEWMQSIATCTDLVSLTFVSCAADGDIPLRFVDSILTNQGAGDRVRLTSQSKWYLSGSLSVGVLRHLKCLHIVHTPISQEFIDSLPACATNLECVLLHKCRGVASLEPLVALKKLRCCALHSSSIEGAGVHALGACERLHRLCLVECRRVTSLAFLQQQPISASLRQLTLSHNWFSLEHMRDVARCAQLVELQLFSLKRLASIAPLAALRKLEVLDLGDTAVTNAGSDEAIRAMQLSRLKLSKCTGISSMTHWLPTQSLGITAIDLSSSGVDTAGLAGLAMCDSLRYLNLTDCTKVTGLAALRGIRGLRWLSVAGTSVTDADLLANLGGGALLRYLCLRDCELVRQLAFLAGMRDLAYLDLENTPLRDRALEPLVQCRGLRLLSLRRCPHVTDVRPVGRLNRLCELDVSYTAITTAGLEPVAGCRALEVLHLSRCPGVTTLAALEQLPRLKELRASHYRQTAANEFRPRPPGPHTRPQSRHAQPAGSPLHDGPQLQHYNPSRPNSRAQSTRSIGSAASNSSMAATSGMHTPRHPRSQASSSSPRRYGGESSGFGSDVGTPSDADTPDGSGGAADVRLCSLGRAYLRRAVLDEAGLMALLAASPLLTQLDIGECRHVTDLRGLEQLTTLLALNAAMCTSLNDAGVYTISLLPSLQSLSLSGCTGVTDLSQLGRLQLLEDLDASVTRVADDGLTQLGACSGLKRLSLAECCFLTSVKPLASLQFLRELRLDYTAVTNAGVAPLASCASLERLYLTKCNNITDVAELRSGLKQLEVLDIYGTSVPSRIAGAPRPSPCAVM